MKLYKIIEKYGKYIKNRFHTPGHSGHLEWLGDGAGLDITELPQVGSLYDATGPIRDSERMMAKALGVADCYYSCGGATLGILSMLHRYCPIGTTVITGRNLHRSGVNAMAMLELNPVWLYPHSGNELPGVYTSERVKKALEQYPDSAAVYIECPNYYGQLNDIKAIAQVCKKAGIPLLVDNAHGGHLYAFGLHPTALGATASVDSVHKTLPALTGSAVLSFAKPQDPGEIKDIMLLYGSTSPSFLMLYGLDKLAYTLVKLPLKEAAVQAEMVRSAAKSAGLTLPSGSCDPLRVAVKINTNKTDREITEYFERKGISPEFVAYSWCVFIITADNYRGCEDLAKAINELAALSSAQTTRAQEAPIENRLPKSTPVASIRQAVYGKTQVVSTAQSAGKVAAQIVAPMPPGVPILIPGEEITEKHLKILTISGIKTVKVLK